MRRLGEVEADHSISKDNNVDIDRFKVVMIFLVLLECAVIDEVIVPKELNLLASFLHDDIFRRQPMDAKGFGQDAHLVTCGAKHI